MTEACPAAALVQGRPVIARPTPALSVILIKLGTGVKAYRNACPHMGIELDWDPRRLLSHSGKYLQCTGHGALFDPATGLCVKGPCAGESLAAVPVRTEDGMVVLEALETAAK
jgi:hypothetical protein